MNELTQIKVLESFLESGKVPQRKPSFCTSFITSRARRDPGTKVGLSISHHSSWQNLIQAQLGSLFSEILASIRIFPISLPTSPAHPTVCVCVRERQDKLLCHPSGSTHFFLFVCLFEAESVACTWVSLTRLGGWPRCSRAHCVSVPPVLGFHVCHLPFKADPYACVTELSLQLLVFFALD